MFYFQVQNRLSGLTSTVSELEEGQRQRALLQQWVAEQHAVVADWRSRPAKLRPEAARAELVSMHELLRAIEERRARAATELPVAEEAEPKLEEQLTKLETEVYEICSGGYPSIR
jgi:nesprin-1